MFFAQVGFFGRIGFEVVELHEGESFAFECGGGLGAAPAAGAGAESELPRAAPDGEGAVDGMVDSEGAPCLAIGLATQGGEEGKGIFAGAGGDCVALAKDVGEGRVEVSGANSFAGGGAGFHFAGPADEEGGAVAAFKNVGFVAAPMGVGLVALGDELGDFGGRRAAVVGGENNDGVLGELLFVQFC